MEVMIFCFEKVHMNFERLLSFVCAENPGTRERTIELIINLSYSNPMQVLASLTEIRLLMFRFCAAPGPDWGTVSSLLFVVANALSTAPDDMQDSIGDVIEMSRIVTAAFLRVNESGPFRPDLQRLVKAVALVFEIKKVKPSLKILVEIVDHAIIGFLESCSLLPVLLSLVEQFANVLKKADPCFYERVAAPLGSSNREIAVAFVQLWISAMPKLVSNELAVQALMRQLKSICELAQCGVAPWAKAAQILMSFIKGEPSVDQVAETVASCKNYKAEPRAKIREVAKEKPKPCETHKALVTWKKGKKWRPVDLTLLEEPQLIVWKKKNKDSLKKGGAICVPSLLDVSLQARDDTDTDNILKLKTKKAEFLFSFKTPEESQRWNSLIHSLMSEVM